MVDLKVVITDDRELAEEIRRQLKERHGYCPCRLERTPDTKCMCKEFRDQMNAGITGPCHCGLYEAVKK
jgi:ferredoxin-thioredoxin reductase catalytic subunit